MASYYAKGWPVSRYANMQYAPMPSRLPAAAIIALDRSRLVPSLAYQAIHASAGTNAGPESGEVQIIGLIPAGVSQAHHPPIRPIEARRHHRTRGHGDNRRPRRRAVIDAEMRAVVAMHRMQPPA